MKVTNTPITRNAVRAKEREITHQAPRGDFIATEEVNQVESVPHIDHNVYFYYAGARTAHRPPRARSETTTPSCICILPLRKIIAHLYYAVARTTRVLYAYMYIDRHVPKRPPRLVYHYVYVKHGTTTFPGQLDLKNPDVH